MWRGEQGRGPALSLNTSLKFSVLLYVRSGFDKAWIFGGGEARLSLFQQRRPSIRDGRHKVLAGGAECWIRVAGLCNPRREAPRRISGAVDLFAEGHLVPAGVL